MTRPNNRTSILHLQMGQEVIYLLLTVAFMVMVVLFIYILTLKQEAAAQIKHELPPILTLSEAEGYYFESGSAELSDKFKERLSENIIPLLKRRGDTYSVDIIEIVGHTDGVPLKRELKRTANLDQKLIEAVLDHNLDDLKVADNVGLGMTRAVAVAVFISGDKLMDDMTVLPFSAGPLIDENGQLVKNAGQGDILERRRIEIRMRRK